MSFRGIFLTVAAMTLLAGPVAAQDTTTTEEAVEAPAEETTTETIPAKPNENDERFPIAEDEKPREKLKATHDDWQVVCSIEDETKCFMYQLARDAEGRVVAEFTMIRLPDGGQAAAGATVVTGLGVLLTRGLGLQIDSSKPLGYPFTYCTPGGCFARLGLTAATVTRLKKGAIAKLSIHAVGAEKPAVGTISLKGFTAAFDDLTPIAE